MAQFCTSCGSPVEENLKFCPKCGAQIAVPSPPAPAAAAPAAGGPAAAPAAKGSPILKIILIVVGLFVVIGIIGAAAGIYVVYKAKQKVTSMVESARTTPGELGTPEIRLERGGEGSEAASLATVDVPPYPGSAATEAGGDFTFGGKGGISSQEYETTDSVEQVLAFYRDKFGSKIRIQESEGNAMFTLSTPGGLTTVTITRQEDSGVTKINISRIGK